MNLGETALYAHIQVWGRFPLYALLSFLSLSSTPFLLSHVLFLEVLATQLACL